MWFNPIVRRLLRSPLYFLAGKNVMLMTYRGRKSGRSYAVPMNYLETDGALLTISSRERLWWRNLRGGAPVSLRLRGADRPAWAECIEDPAAVAGKLSLYLQASPQFARYLHVRMDAQNEPNPEDLARLATQRVVVSTVLK